MEREVGLIDSYFSDWLQNKLPLLPHLDAIKATIRITTEIQTFKTMTNKPDISCSIRKFASVSDFIYTAVYDAKMDISGSQIFDELDRLLMYREYIMTDLVRLLEFDRNIRNMQREPNTMLKCIRKAFPAIDLETQDINIWMIMAMNTEANKVNQKYNIRYWGGTTKILPEILYLWKTLNRVKAIELLS